MAHSGTEEDQFYSDSDSGSFELEDDDELDYSMSSGDEALPRRGRSRLALGAGYGEDDSEYEEDSEEGEGEEEEEEEEVYQPRRGIRPRGGGLGRGLQMTAVGGGSRRKRKSDTFAANADSLQCPDEDPDRCYMPTANREGPESAMMWDPRTGRQPGSRTFRAYNANSAGRTRLTRGVVGEGNRVLPGSARSTQEYGGIMDDGIHKYYVMKKKMPVRDTDKPMRLEENSAMMRRVMHPNNRGGKRFNGTGVVRAFRPGRSGTDPKLAREAERKTVDRYWKPAIENNMNGIYPTGTMKPMLLPPTHGKRWADYDRTLPWQPGALSVSALNAPHNTVALDPRMMPGQDRITGSDPLPLPLSRATLRLGPGTQPAFPGVMQSGSDPLPLPRPKVSLAPKISLGMGQQGGNMVGAVMNPTLRTPYIVGQMGQAAVTVGGAAHFVQNPASVQGSADRVPRTFENTRAQVQTAYTGQHLQPGAVERVSRTPAVVPMRLQQNTTSFAPSASMQPQIIDPRTGNTQNLFSGAAPTATGRVGNTGYAPAVPESRKMNDTLVNQQPVVHDAVGAGDGYGPQPVALAPRARTMRRTVDAPAPRMSLGSSDANKGSWLSPGSLVQPKAATANRLVAQRSPTVQGAFQGAADPSMQSAFLQPMQRTGTVTNRAPAAQMLSINADVGAAAYVQTATQQNKQYFAGRMGQTGTVDVSAAGPAIVGIERQAVPARAPQTFRTGTGLQMGAPTQLPNDPKNIWPAPSLTIAQGFRDTGLQPVQVQTSRKAGSVLRNTRALLPDAPTGPRANVRMTPQSSRRQGSVSASRGTTRLFRWGAAQQSPGIAVASNQRIVPRANKF